MANPSLTKLNWFPGTEGTHFAGLPAKKIIEPRHLRRLRLAVEAASDEAHRIELAARRHHDAAAAAWMVKVAIADERKAWAAYRRAFNRQLKAAA
jgi:hypothetical protein